MKLTIPALSDLMQKLEAQPNVTSTAPEITISAADLSRLHDEMRIVVLAAERVQLTIDQISGGDQAALYLKGNLQRGAGYFRISADTIERLFRERNTQDAAIAKAKELEGGE